VNLVILKFTFGCRNKTYKEADLVEERDYSDVGLEKFIENNLMLVTDYFDSFDLDLRDELIKKEKEELGYTISFLKILAVYKQYLEK
jgi:hypothetical protein